LAAAGSWPDLHTQAPSTCTVDTAFISNFAGCACGIRGPGGGPSGNFALCWEVSAVLPLGRRILINLIFWTQYFQCCEWGNRGNKERVSLALMSPRVLLVRTRGGRMRGVNFLKERRDDAGSRSMPFPGVLC